jgi:hypothetical protein
MVVWFGKIYKERENIKRVGNIYKELDNTLHPTDASTNNIIGGASGMWRIFSGSLYIFPLFIYFPALYIFSRSLYIFPLFIYFRKTD